MSLNQREVRMNCLLSRMKERDNDDKSSAELGEMTAVYEENLKLVGPNSELLDITPAESCQNRKLGR